MADIELQFSTSSYFTFLSDLPCELHFKQKKLYSVLWKCRRGICLEVNADQEKGMVLVGLSLLSGTGQVLLIPLLNS